MLQQQAPKISNYDDLGCKYFKVICLSFQMGCLIMCKIIATASVRQVAYHFRLVACCYISK